jgi:amidase
LSEELELAYAGPERLGELVLAREVRPRELVELFLGRISRLDPALNAFRLVLPDLALERADALERAMAGRRSGAGAAPMPLAGVPIAVKDDMPMAGQRVTLGSRSPAPVQEVDAEPLRRLRAAGAIPIGITRVPELMVFPWTAGDAGGITRNPWDLGRTPGGSSGGSAAAVAAGLAAAATGSDGAGSIRIPAACCGLVGMKPTRGRVSTRPLVEPWLGLSTFGALARTVGDSALLLDAMHGGVPGEAALAPPPVPFREAARHARPAPLRVAVSRRPPPGVFAPLCAGQRLALTRTADLLDELGHDVRERDPSYGLSMLELTQTYLRAIHEDLTRLADPSLAERATRQMAGAGRLLVPPRRRAALLARRARTTARILELWRDHDVLLTPGLSRTALPAEGGYGRQAPIALELAARFTPFTPIFNLTGQPAIAIPAGFGSDGLPLSVQLVGRPGSEDVLYALAAQLEAARPWSQLHPPLG